MTHRSSPRRPARAARAAVVPAQPRQPQCRRAAGGQRRRGRVGRREKGLSFSYTLFHLFSARAQFQRRLIQERTQAGLTAARARGRHGGRRPITTEEPRVRMAAAMYAEHNLTCAEIWQTLGISRATFYRYVTLGRQGTLDTV